MCPANNVRFDIPRACCRRIVLKGRIIIAYYEQWGDSAVVKPMDICLFRISIHVGLLSTSFHRSAVNLQLQETARFSQNS